MLAGSAARTAHVKPMAAESTVGAVPAAFHAAETSNMPLEKLKDFPAISTCPASLCYDCEAGGKTFGAQLGHEEYGPADFPPLLPILAPSPQM